MTTSAPTPRPRPPLTVAPPSMGGTVTAPSFEMAKAVYQPPKGVLYAGPGWGKTSFAAYAENVGLICTRDELGYRTLLANGLVPAVSQLVVNSWPELLGVLDGLAKDCPFKNIAIDALGGMEVLCREHLIRTEFDGKDKNFSAYGHGNERMVNQMIGLCARLDRIHEKGVGIWLLAHSRVKSTPNPEGEDYQQFEVDVTSKVFAPIWRWSNVVLLGHVSRTVNDDGKAIGAEHRLCYTSPGAAYIAKNQYGLPPVISLSLNPAANYETIINYMRGESGAQQKG